MDRLKRLITKTVKACLLVITMASHTLVAETLTQNTVLGAGNYAYSEALVVSSGVTLTIEAGAALSFSTSTKLLVKEGGKLFIQGTAAQPVVLTSDVQLAGSWDGLHFEGRRTTADEIVLDNVIIEYADKALYSNQAGMKATVTNSTVRYNNVGLYLDGYYQSAPNHPVINFTQGALYDNVQWNIYTQLFHGSVVTTIDATGNWWGSNDPQLIAGTIQDLLDGSHMPAVDFSGYRESEQGAAIGTSYAGYVSGNETWNATDGILAQPIIIGNGGTLTIAAGAQVKAKAGSKLLVKEGGKLFIQGTAAQPVVFTSDAQVAGSWDGLHFEGRRTTADEIVLDNVIIEYADKALYSNQAGMKATVTNSTVRYNNVGVYLDGYYQSAPNHPVINFTQGALYDNVQWNIYTQLFHGSVVTTIDATGNWWGSNDPQLIAGTIQDLLDGSHMPAVDFSGYRESEQGAAIGTSYAGYVSGNETWNATDGILAQPIIIGNGGTLTIAAGAQLKAKAGSKLLVKEGGKLFIQGTAAQPVVFTSDAQVAGSWDGLHFEGRRTTADEIVLDNVIIEYADKALYSNQAGMKATVTNSTVRYNNVGVYLDGYYQSAPNHPVINFTQGALYDNVQWNIYTQLFHGSVVTTIDATGNWWGSNDPQLIAGTIQDLLDGSHMPAVDFSGYRESEQGAAIGTSYAGYVSGNETWNATDGILAQPIIIGNGGTLTIAAGAQVKAKAGSKLLVKEGGKLFIQGTAAQPVVFTSDAQVAGSWDGLHFEGRRTTADEIVLDNVIIEYADKALYSNQAGMKATVTNSTVRYNNVGLYLDGYYQSAPNHPVINFTQGALYDNVQWNIYTQLFHGSVVTTIDATGNWWGSSEIDAIAASIWDISDSSYTANVNFSGFLTSKGGNPLPGTHVLGSVHGEQRWNFTDGIALGDITVRTGSSLVVEAGTNLSFLGNNKLVVEDGASFTVIGDSDNPVTFTSGKLNKLSGDWGGIEVKSNTDVTILNAVIEYAEKGILFTGIKSSGQVTNSTIQHNKHGVHVDAMYHSLANHPAPIVTNNVFQHNTNFNYYSERFGNASSRTLNAKGNYWGTADTAAIAQGVFDHSDNNSSPLVDVGFARATQNSLVTADAGGDTIGFGTVATILSGTGSSNVAITDYAWKQYLGDDVTLNNANSSDASFTVPDVASDKLYAFIFTVVDANEISASDKLNVVVKPFIEYNKAPTVAGSRELLVQANDAVSVTINATDDDNDPLTFSWVQTSGDAVTLNTTTTDTLSFKAPSHTQNKVYKFKLAVSDGNYTVTRTVLVAVKPANAIAGTYYYHNDHLGTPQVMTDGSAVTVWEADYTPFGDVEISVETVRNNLRFAGQYFDEESGLHYNYFRDYDPELGRYIQSDPIGLAGGVNTYAYVGGNPIKYIDPYGLEAWVNAFPNTNGGFDFVAHDDQGSPLITGSFNNDTINSNQIRPGTYNVTPRPELPSTLTNWFFNRNKKAGFPTVSNTDDWNTISYSDGHVTRGAQFHEGINGTSYGSSEACMVSDRTTNDSLNRMFLKNYNNGGVTLTVFPSGFQGL